MSSVRRQHFFHLVAPSPWPWLMGMSLFLLGLGAAMVLHFYTLGKVVFELGLLSVVLCMFLWWNDVVIEGTYLGCHTRIVQRLLRFGVVLFITSEVMFFLSFFWAFFHSSLAPTVEIGSIWPPFEIKVFNPWEVPLLNTFILLTSGCTVTWAHYLMCVPTTQLTLSVPTTGNNLQSKELWATKETARGSRERISLALASTVLLAIFFTGFQAYEYVEAPFTIMDGIYGSTFFMLTGFHGIHVIVGTIFLTVCLFRNMLGHFSVNHHIGFEGAVWYWHFVDVVWLFLFVVVYWWGGALAN